jgi:hypothetical protein
VMARSSNITLSPSGLRPSRGPASQIKRLFAGLVMEGVEMHSARI